MHIKNTSCSIQSPPRLYRFHIKFVLSKSIQIKGREILLLTISQVFLIGLIHCFFFFETYLIFNFWSLLCSTYEMGLIIWLKMSLTGKCMSTQVTTVGSGFCLLTVGETGGHNVNRIITNTFYPTGRKQYELKAATI